MQVMAKVGAFNVRANCLSPGMVKTPLNESVWSAGQEQLPEEERQSYEDWAADKIKTIAPLGRWQQPPNSAPWPPISPRPTPTISPAKHNIDGGK